MDIGLIAKTVEKNIQGDRLVFSDATVGVPYIIKLFNYHLNGKDCFELTEIKCSLEENILTVSGKGVLPDQSDCELEMEFTNDSEGNLLVKMPRQYLMTLPGVELACQCSYEKQMWKITFSSERVYLSKLLTAAITFLGISIPPESFGKTGAVSDMKFWFELPFAEKNAEDNDQNVNLWNYFSLSFQTDLEMDLSAVFEKGNQVGLSIRSFLIEKAGEVCNFSFQGRLKIWSVIIPFQIRYNGTNLMLATVKEKDSHLAIPSVNDLGRLIGIKDLHLPDSLSSLTNFEVKSVCLAVASDFSRLSSFDTVIFNHNKWQIVETPDIHIANIIVGFQKRGQDVTVFIGGDLFLEDWLLVISAAYQSEGGWIFRACLTCDENPLNLSDLFRKLCRYLEFPEIPFSLPDLPFGSALISYNMHANQFGADLEIGKLKADFRYIFAPEKSYRLELSTDYEISLEKLPLVGTDLHLLEGKVIKSIRFEAASDYAVLYLDFAGKALKLKLSGTFPEEKEEKALTESAGQERDALTEVYDSSRGTLRILWVPVELKFSVFTIHRLGVGFDGEKITLALEAELSAGAFQLSLTGLSLSVAVREIAVPDFGLSGLSVGFRNPALSISGGFKRYVQEGRNFYEGILLVGVKGIQIFLVGSYSEGSFLAYGLVHAKIGGPPAFTVTGLAVGFGYNKYLRLPDISEVERYPLVEAAVNTKVSSGELLNKMQEEITLSKGQNFLAAGVSFESFGMVSSFALLTVSFGRHLEVALLGISEIKVPPRTKKEPIAQAKLGLKAAFLPEQGVFSAEAQLLSDSYVLSSKCKLTGGFALYFWFGGEHKGDFVISLGGYRDGYQKPAHYPEVPRIGFVWDISALKISGEMYFALTPSAVSAGGKLEAVYKQGELRAWFTAYVDIEMGWKPFYYDFSVVVSLGASITLNLWLFSHTFTLEMSVDLHIYGPEFGGIAHVKWWVISFTISFDENKGERGSGKKIEWQEFKESFLKLQSAEKTNATDGEQILTINAAEGVVGKIGEKGAQTEVLNADSARFVVESLIPSADIEFNRRQAASTEKLGVLPMGKVTLVSRLSIRITYGQTDQNREKQVECSTEEIRQNVPKALWSKEEKSTDDTEELINDALLGLALTPCPKAFTFFPEDKFLTLDMLSEYEKIEKNYVFSTVVSMDTEGVDTEFAEFKKAASQIKGKQKTFMTQMEQYGFTFTFEPSLDEMAGNAENLFDEEFLLGSRMSSQ